MIWLETLRVSWNSIRTNKMRSFLTMLGIIIGVIAVIASFGVGVGASDMITKQIETLGSNILMVMPGSTASGGINHGFGSASTLTYANVQQILAQDPAVSAASAVESTNAQIVYGANNTNTSVQGVDVAYPVIKNISIAQGRFFQTLEETQGAAVAVLGSQIEQTLFTGTSVNPVGQTIDINGIPFTVIGVEASQGASGFQNPDNSITIPITTMMNLFTGGQSINTLVVSATSPNTMNQAQQQIESTLRVAHQLAPGVSDDFSIVNQATILSALGSVTTILTALLGSISAISLLVGGIGIMNIMLVSVTERTREIGIRKAIGATRSNILSQFLMESLVLSLGGAIAGLIIGAVLVDAVAMMMKLSNLVSPLAVIVSVVFSVGIGIIFGVYPARKAAQLNPIDALRYE